jgi:hypothetical protein
MRKKIHLTMDEDSLDKIESMSTYLYIPKGIVIDNLLEYVLRNEINCSHKNLNRSKLTTTVNPDLWKEFKEYADLHRYKYNHLLEEALSYEYKKYEKKIKNKV